MSYFGYHAIEGDRGLQAYARLSQEVTIAQQALAETGRERREMERRVSLLRADRLDLDMLDEQARRILGLVRADEIVIYDEQ
ncbi:MAG: septum formation initiator family protein [Alphaproteobacteria bacterium]|nr:septum formation initiator family protein [Alphaproteobacteria bacterium]